MISNIITIGIALITLVVTMLGWFFTHSKQEEIVKIQGEIQKSVAEHDTRYSYLHNKRGQILDELYKQMVKIMALFSASVSRIRLDCESSPAEQQREAITLSMGLSRYYYSNKLYLDQSLCKEMEAFTKSLAQVMSNLGIAREMEPYMDSNPKLKEMWAKVDAQHMSYLDNASKIITEELPEIQEHIEKQMRKIIGTE